MCRDMEMGELKCAGQSEDQRDVLLLEFCRELFQRYAPRMYVCRWPGGYAAGERSVIVYVKFEEVEERVVDNGDCAIEFWE